MGRGEQSELSTCKVLYLHVHVCTVHLAPLHLLFVTLVAMMMYTVGVKKKEVMLSFHSAPSRRK